MKEIENWESSPKKYHHPKRKTKASASNNENNEERPLENDGLFFTESALHQNPSSKKKVEFLSMRNGNSQIQ